MALRHRVHGGVELGTGATIFTFNNNLVEGGAILWSFSIANLSGSSRTVTINLVPSGGSASEDNGIFEEVIPPHSTVGFGGPWHENSGAFIVAGAGTANSSVSLRITASEEYQAF